MNAKLPKLPCNQHKLKAVSVEKCVLPHVQCKFLRVWKNSQATGLWKAKLKPFNLLVFSNLRQRENEKYKYQQVESRTKQEKNKGISPEVPIILLHQIILHNLSWA